MATKSTKSSTPRKGQQMANHGSSRYAKGCRCAECTEAHRLRAVDYRTRKEESEPLPAQTAPGQVETAVEAEIGGLAVSRPSLAAIAVAMARILDNPRAKSTQPQAAKVLVSVLDTLHKGSAQGRRGSLALVKSMTTSSPSA
jgi:hypothetical protein